MRAERASRGDLARAYRATWYRIAAPAANLILRIDHFDAALARLMKDSGVDGAAVLTAWNPGSTLRTAGENRNAQIALQAELSTAGYAQLAGINEPMEASARASWSEASVLALGITQDAALRIAGAYGQRAFVWMDGDATPRLHFTAA